MLKVDRKTGETSYTKVDYKKVYEDSQAKFHNTDETINLLNYLSPEDERSIYKGIPRHFRFHPAVRALMITGRFSVKYRGSSKPELGYKRPQSNAHSRYADTFAIYNKSEPRYRRTFGW